MAGCSSGGGDKPYRDRLYIQRDGLVSRSVLMKALLGRALLPLVGSSLLAACVVPAPVPPAEPAPAAQSAPQPVVPASSEDSLPTPHAVLNLPKAGSAVPAGKPAPAAASQSAPAGKPGKHPDEKPMAVEPRQSVSAASKEAPSRGKAPGAASVALMKEFPWLQSCQKRIEFGGAVQCDVDTLLAQPSARVQVFVREAKLARTFPDGLRIQLREGLPRLYRLFVLP